LLATPRTSPCLPVRSAIGIWPGAVASPRRIVRRCGERRTASRGRSQTTEAAIEAAIHRCLEASPTPVATADA